MSHKLPRTLQAVPNTLHARLEIADAMRKLSAADQEGWMQQRREELAALRRDMEKVREDLRKISRAFPTLLLTELRKTGFNPDEPRVLAGDSKGGQWTKDGGSGSWIDSVADWFRHTSDPEWADAQNVQDLVENHPRAAIISGSVGLAIPFAAAGAFALPELLGAGAIAEGPAATLELAQEIANVEFYLMRFRRTIALLETAEGPTLVAGGGTDLSAAQIAMARQLGLTPVTGVGEHAELTAIAGARSLGLTPTAGVTTIHICPSCAVKIYNMGGWLTVARHFAFGR
jgi:hypothetical protein